MKLHTRCFRLSLFFMLLVPAFSFSSGLSLGFRFYGGLHSMSGGDLNSGMAGKSKLYEVLSESSGFSVGGKFKDLGWGFAGGGDLMISVTPRMGFEVGVGYASASKETAMTYSGPGIEGFWTIKPSAAAIPVRAGLFVLLPLGSALSASIHGGAALYLAKVETSVRTGSQATGFWRQENQTATAEGVGFYGGLGLELRIIPGVFLLLEAQGRLARFDGFDGDSTMSDSNGKAYGSAGILYYFEQILPPGYSEPRVDSLAISDKAPEGTDLSDVRPARVDFSGFGIALGFVIRL